MPSDGSIKRLRLRRSLDAHGISFAQPPFIHRAFPATTDKEFTSRRIRYTVRFGLHRQTRETDVNMLSTELAALISRGAILVGIDGIDGFKCGPTDDELRQFSHPLE